ncbi:MAG: tRNA lysidine(34) synthetase TilS [Rhodobacteraceae bacterium]|nr:tRNA lysidine(34) synthetase TilS [Paracoccaceae bacterium]
MAAEAVTAALRHLAKTFFAADPPARFGVAVSGGGDSMALLQLFHHAFPGRVCAATVDHGLRAHSAAEAAGVAAFCAAQGISHSTLRWQGPSPVGNLMDQARHARTALLADWAKGLGMSNVLLGHTADDQAETFLMNLGRAAGLDGLSGMRGRWTAQGICWARPLLGVSRADLRHYLGGQGVAWVDDPSNENDRFTRVRARKALTALAPLGITVETLNTSILNLARARQALSVEVADLADRLVVLAAGAAQLSRSQWLQLAPEMRRRLLLAIIGWMGGAAHAPREAQTLRLDLALHEGRDATLAGLRFRSRGDRVDITREPRAVMGAVPLGAVWDHRWRVLGPADPDAEIRALGEGGLRLCPDWRGHGPREALVVTPAVWSGDRLIAAPLAGVFGQYQAELSQGLPDFIITH